jgi:alpha-tubulin suppressor-like RCC1 family protein
MTIIHIRTPLLVLALVAIVAAASALLDGSSPRAEAAGATAIDAGGEHTCSVTSGGGAKCWGTNSSGALGVGTTTGPETCAIIPCSRVPVTVSGLGSGVTAVSAAIYGTCALTTGGGVKCWGENTFGQLGDGQACGTLCPSPVNVTGLSSGVASVAAGDYHSCALTTGGGVKCWGRNASGQLGDGQACGSFWCANPVNVSGLGSGVAAISAGSQHTCALTTGGAVKCWGDNGHGPLGDGTTVHRTAPVNVSGLGSGVVAISTGTSNTCAITTGAALKCWGVNITGELGIGTTIGPETCSSVACATTPVDVPSLGSGVAAVSVGGDHVCAVVSGGGKCWGSNSYGKLGIGTSMGPETCGISPCSTTPLNVSGLASGVSAISAGGGHTCALAAANVAKCWGDNLRGPLGVGSATGPETCTGDPCSTVPVDVLGLGGNVIITPDTDVDVGILTSLKLDAQGNPVVAHHKTGDVLRVLHCGNVYCSANNVTSTPDPSGDDAGAFASLALDENGYPVVSSFNFDTQDLNVVHCNDANCAGGDDSLTSPDLDGGGYTSLVLDNNTPKRPVISYHDASSRDLKFIHCDDANCAGSETVWTLDSTGDVGQYTAVALAGTNPTIAYYDDTNGDLKLKKCADPTCTAIFGTNPVDQAGDVGEHVSMVLDASNFPVIAYSDVTNANLKVAHCNDIACAPGGDSVVTVDSTGFVGNHTSIALNAQGVPVISYGGNGDLKIVRCGNPNCSKGNIIVTPDSLGAVGTYTSLALDSAGNPVVSYQDGSNGHLKVLHCTTPTCSLPPDSDQDGCTDTAEQNTAVGSQSSGGRRNYKLFWDFFDVWEFSGTWLRDEVISLDDVFALVPRFATTGSTTTSPLVQPTSTSNYHVAYDRTFLGPDLWDLGPPDGVISLDEMLWVGNQFAHSCA